MLNLLLSGTKECRALPDWFPLTIVQLIYAALIMAGCSFIQSAVGFGFGLFAVPLLIFAGLSLPSATSLMISAVFVQTAFTTWYFRHDVPWRPAVRASIIRNLTLPIGAFLMLQLDQAGTSAVKQVIGGLLIVIVLTFYFARIQPRERLHWAWEIPAFVGSGVTGGMVGMGGPTLVLWVMAHDWTNPQTRSFLLFNFMSSSPLQITLIALIFGWEMLVVAGVGLVFTPILYAGTQAGLRVGHRLSRERLKNISLLLLFLLAISALAEPLFFGE